MFKPETHAATHPHTHGKDKTGETLSGTDNWPGSYDGIIKNKGYFIGKMTVIFVPLLKKTVLWHGY